MPVEPIEAGTQACRWELRGEIDMAFNGTGREEGLYIVTRDLSAMPLTERGRNLAVQTRNSLVDDCVYVCRSE
jgi:hypothetical protein